MAKIRIPVEQLPPPNSNGDHAIQFRVISEDRNRISAWSNLFVVKSIGQYRPLESDYVFQSASPVVSVTWDTPKYYNYDGISDAIVKDISGSVTINSASVVTHNHSQNFKRHETDIFVKWDSNSFEYHDRVLSDTTSITVPAGSSSVRIVGTVATHNIPQQGSQESLEDFGQRIDEHVEGLIDLFKIFDTGTRSVT